MYNYGFTFEYREVKDGNVETECLFISSNDKDMENACTIAMLQYIKKHNYYSAKLIKTIKW